MGAAHAGSRIGPEVGALRLLSDPQQAEEERLGSALADIPLTVASFDLDLRYTWIHNPHPDFDPWDVIGRRDDELDASPGTEALMDLKRHALQSQRPLQRAIAFERSGGPRVYQVIAKPIRDGAGNVTGGSTVGLDVTEREQGHERFEAAVREAERDRDETLAVLAHELRTPLTTILAAVQLLARRSESPLPPYVSVVERQVRGMARLIHDLLDDSRLRSGNLVLHRTSFDLSAAVAEAVERTSGDLATRYQRVELLARAKATVSGDRDRIVQIVTNLISNASRYSPDGSTIWIEDTAETDHASVRVRDEGRGMTPEQLAVVFEMFRRGAEGSGEEEAGLGIGLALSRRIAELHGGSLDGSSPGLDQGSAFELRIPMALSDSGG
jgi:signal transduction histidine kinase